MAATAQPNRTGAYGPPRAAAPVPIRRIGPGDLRAALREGYGDFLEKRGDLVFIGFVYPLVGIVTAVAALGNSILPLFFPLVAGLSLLGPVVSSGFYELARRREAGLESSWWHFFDVFRNPSGTQIALVSGLLFVIFLAWIVAAALLYRLFLGEAPPESIGGFLTTLFTTPEGWGMMIVGDLVGLVFALLVLALGLVSLPMLVDRPVDPGVAIATSIRAVRANPGVTLRWGVTVVVLLLLGSIPFFLGLAVALPVLGYATWHLYTRLVDRSALPPRPA
ncbi:MAG TPA: DUF2189 domain-containing protein [Sphingomonadaceae bacterium]|jgi:uncharacterized membrane protein|nr:DUF2189 domain-containing protein [Sphingomonadaceae bacterium]